MQITNVFGPYEHARGFRLVLKCEDGSKNSRQFGDKAEAEGVKRALLRQIEASRSITLASAFGEYHAHMKRLGNKEVSITTAMIHLRQFFDDPSRTVASLTPQYCSSRYEALSERVSASKGKRVATDTHRSELRAARTFGKWCVEKGWIAKDPTRGIRGVGRRSYGKPQLRIDEGKRFVDKAVELAKGDNQAASSGASACLVALFMSFRSSEIISREVRDLDDDGRYLIIERTEAFSGKSAAAARKPEVPEVLQPCLKRLAEGKQPTDKLFGERRPRWLLGWVNRICKLAGAPRVTAHALRGMCSTYAVENGVATHAVAALMGHSSPRMTEQAYLAPGTQRARAQRELVARLSPFKEPE